MTNLFLFFSRFHLKTRECTYLVSDAFLPKINKTVPNKTRTYFTSKELEISQTAISGDDKAVPTVVIFMLFQVLGSTTTGILVFDHVPALEAFHLLSFAPM